MIYGRAKIIRECLLKRGWIEKLNRRNSNGEKVKNNLTIRTFRRSRCNFSTDQQTQQTQQQLQQQSQQQLQLQQQQQSQGLTNQPTMGIDTSPVILLSGVGDLKDDQSQRLLMSKMLSNYAVDLLWNSGSDWPGWPSQDNKKTIFNRYTRAAFTSKVTII